MSERKWFSGKVVVLILGVVGAMLVTGAQELTRRLLRRHNGNHQEGGPTDNSSSESE